MGSLVQVQEGEHKKANLQWVGLFCFHKDMFGVYILYSEKSNRYYVGYTDDMERRLREHNSLLTDSFTSKHRPWALILFLPVSGERKYAVRMEKLIKGKKSKTFIQNFIKYPELREKLLQTALQS